MKSNVVTPALAVPGYPTLMASNATPGLVVLMERDSTGTVVVGSGSWRTGNHHTAWNMSAFIPLPAGSTVAITQE